MVVAESLDKRAEKAVQMMIDNKAVVRGNIGEHGDLILPETVSDDIKDWVDNG
ncbi:hypothetical protein [Pseudolactococcus insecticola]|uniref:Uncharacterized protein n=1 Tax=Pseudolactococcus insecticola TaxID=2709158 RepID=A0A6A0B992_9LACT|nr:hypothetical protein [Lactococcus insecticola]GFH41305.1 hypothetical protein Hs20B_17030 [Lactococcus insecticola]